VLLLLLLLLLLGVVAVLTAVVWGIRPATAKVCKIAGQPTAPPVAASCS
jgi:hypothetical protein